jgi:hypothetical protein
LQFHGHVVARGNVSPTLKDEYELMPFPRTFSGQIHERSKHQIFASTDPAPLVDGMCGGPVVITGEPRSAAADGPSAEFKLCGLVEGIVPLQHPDRSLCGKAVFVEYPEIVRSALY